MSKRLEARIPDPQIRAEFLQTLYYESRRSNVSPSLTLAIADALSNFRK